jgi:hypothetical protein
MSYLIFPVSNGENNGIAFITLNAFEVLHEKPFSLVRCEELFELWKILALTIKGHLYPLGMLDPHGNDAEAFGRTDASVFNHEINHSLNLSRGALLLCSVARNLRHHLVPDDLAKPRTRKGN